MIWRRMPICVSVELQEERNQLGSRKARRSYVGVRFGEPSVEAVSETT